MDNIQTGLRETILLKTFLPVFLQREKTHSLKLKSLSITTPNNFCFELSQMFALPIRVQIFLC